MHLFNFVRRGIGMVLLAACGTLCAAPVTFKFVLPAWGTNTFAGVALFGPNATVQVTVDDGTSTTTNQAYAFGEITKVYLTAGSYSNTWLKADANVNGTPAFDFIFTDAGGVPTLDLIPDPVPGSRIIFSNSGGTWAFGVGGPGNDVSYTAVWLQEGAQFTGAALAFISSPGFTVVGSAVDPNAVPLPSSISLVLLALAGLAVCTRRSPRRAGCSNAPSLSPMVA